ncbi:hypothetical protein BJ912DRAFT_901653 [Pholiota molesta]|nr:hypothetical protein BJ912DRAFT_901653 [Pholiota molesta]
MSRSMRQRLPLYHSLHRPSSHPLSTLAASPPSTSRPVLSSPPRLPSEAPKQSPHSQLALTQPAPGLQQAPLFPYTPPILAPARAPAEAPPSAAVPHPAPDTPRAHKRARLAYQLDVGAYGIPKSRPAPAAPHHHPHRGFHSRAAPPVPHTHRSVQVGEDAYFVMQNAMGIADGVGGWARVAPQAAPQHPTPSALFSRRLMHFCAAELEALDAALEEAEDAALSAAGPAGGAGVRPPTTTRFSFEHHLKPRPAPPPQPIRADPYAYAFAELEDSLDELADGIDVLQILERAYDSTVRAHVAPPSTSAASPTPLTTGSSTALLAVLDHPPAGPLKQSPEAPHRNYAAGSLPLPVAPSVADPAEPDQAHAEAHTIEPMGSGCDAVVHIAHLGDCMGMLVRGDKIVWRSDEMWWGYNHPLQLGPPPAVHLTPPPPTPTHPAPPTPTPPRHAPRNCTRPTQQLRRRSPRPRARPRRMEWRQGMQSQS